MKLAWVILAVMIGLGACTDSDENEPRRSRNEEDEPEQQYQRRGKGNNGWKMTTSTTGSVVTKPKPVCDWGQWGEWSRCDCHTGVQNRIRNPAWIYNGKCTIDGCAGESRPCRRTTCPVDCVYSKWSSWSECDGPCGDFTRHRYRGTRVPELYGGKRCHRFDETETCIKNSAECFEPDCEVSEWGAWGECEAMGACNDCYGFDATSTSTGSQVRSRRVIAQGEHCPHLHESQHCELTCC